MKPQIRVGKTYKNRYGVKVKIVSYQHASGFYTGDNGEDYDPYGISRTFFISNLVEEVNTEPERHLVFLNGQMQLLTTEQIPDHAWGKKILKKNATQEDLDLATVVMGMKHVHY